MHGPRLIRVARPAQARLARQAIDESHYADAYQVELPQGEPVLLPVVEPWLSITVATSRNTGESHDYPAPGTFQSRAGLGARLQAHS